MKNRKIIISSLGNVVEWFDFGLFIFMSPIIGAKFFPAGSAHNATIDALMVFAIGFLCRPIGGIFFGYLGDTRGRVIALRSSILVITLSTLLVALIPSYEEVGLIAPTIFIILRLVQGLSIGGEYSGVTIYLAESAFQKNRGFITSFAAEGSNLGFLLATLSFILLHLFFSEEMILAWAWRVPFLLIGIPGLLIIYYRFRLSETDVYTRLKAKHMLDEMPLITALKAAPYQLIKIVGLTCMSSTFYYFFVGYSMTYLEHSLGLTLKMALILQSLMLIAMLFIVPIGGFCGDYFSRKKVMIINSLAIMVFIFPCFYLLQSGSLLSMALAIGLATILSSLDQGNTLTACIENCPENLRYSGIGFSYNLGNALFGGTTPLLITLLGDNIHFLAPACYLFFMAMIGFISAISILSNNRSLGPINVNKNVKLS